MQHDTAQAMVQHDNANGSINSKEVRVSDNIRALRRAIMNVERAMELDDQMEEFEQYAETIGNDQSFAQAKYYGKPFKKHLFGDHITFLNFLKKFFWGSRR